MSTYVADFSGTAGDPPPAEWTFVELESAATSEAVLTGDGGLNMRRASGTGGNMALYLAGRSGTNGRIIARMSVNDSGFVTYTSGGPFVRAVPPVTADPATERLEFNQTDTELRVRHYNSLGTVTTVGTVAQTRAAPGTEFWLETEFDGTVGRMRTWLTTDPTPGAGDPWDLTVTADQAVPANPIVGIHVATSDSSIVNEGITLWAFEHEDYDAAAVTYTLSTAVVGSGTVSGGGTYDDGTVVTVEATPAAGWSFSGWSGALTGSTNPTTVTMDSDKSVTATFTEDAVYDPDSLTVTMTGQDAALSWPAPAMVGADQVDIFRRGPGGLTGAAFVPTVDTPIARVAVATTSYADTSLPAGDYEWQVFPVDTGT